ncbi:Cobalt-precorrin-2 C(20)-methyltransferase [hydrothermal vent metagenome]|uniref:Cobalt-precorrin-2 C(20)-methyltransferase n=1 Tax=hydrothermal vent metagenome TaxID=652676 RepID=A0A3B1BT84_9ZZZZ
MSLGKLYGIGVGPGDPELISVKGARLISETKHLFVPIARIKKKSVALDIVKKYVKEGTNVKELVFPMVTDKSELNKRWDESARIIADTLESGADAVFLTLGDALLYSTYIYLLRSLRKIHPDVNVVTIPGITAFSAVAALTDFPVGEAKEPVTIVPTSDDLQAARGAIELGGTVILMKVGKRLQNILDLLEEMDAMEGSVFVANAGMESQRLVTDLRKLKGENDQTGYLSTILIKSQTRTKK